jgi:hypothetical protein
VQERERDRGCRFNIGKANDDFRGVDGKLNAACPKSRVLVTCVYGVVKCDVKDVIIVGKGAARIVCEREDATSLMLDFSSWFEDIVGDLLAN